MLILTRIHIIPNLAFSLLVFLLISSPSAAGPISSGESFPEVLLPPPPELAQRNYLGLVEDRPFSLNQISARVVLVEVLNVLCPHCQKQTAPYNQLYRMIEADPETRGQIKLLGVAVANDDEAIDDFVVIYSVAFPVVPDRTFTLHRALRAGPTPFSVYALRDHPEDTFVVTDTHLGVDREVNELFVYLKDLLKMPVSEFTSLPREEIILETQPNPPQSETEIAERVKQSFSAHGQALLDFQRLKLPSDRWVYSASLIRNGKRQPLFAEVGNRSAICDVCHSVHFFYIFDRNGLILDFVPLHLTKYGNVEWNEAEVRHFSSRVVGRKLADPWHFQPKYDAVTSATMTSAIIFDDLGQGQALLDELHREKWISP
ncbi:MAG: redoxin domain-containing protein [Desulfuromonadales bacterium]|nr:redoxin domain-containing protein [Desulfuromonadales bacterium]MBN2792458.1 redoxin domain-containing protein [Desulfuromonadales bacterium]